MNCGHCVEAVTRAVRKADPDATLKIDLGGRTAAIDAAARRVTAVIEQAGFHRSPLPKGEA